MTKPRIGVIGGSGVYDLPGLTGVEERAIASPWGEPSDALRFGLIGATEAVFLPRHGRGHRLSPSDIDYRANIDALKRAGCTDVVAVSACGSYKENLPPGTFVLVDQFVDRTVRRQSSFFGRGCVAHVPFAHPVSPGLQRRLAAAAEAEGVGAVMGGTYVCMEGPQFSTLAESLACKRQGFDVIGMTAMPEAKLVREAEMGYALVAMVTDFDCWHPEHDHVDVRQVIAVAHANAGRVARLLARFLADLPRKREPCPLADRALDGAMMTAPDRRDPALLARLDAIAGRALAGAH
jgi:5'-methylthioadenosine phosphorylase